VYDGTRIQVYFDGAADGDAGGQTGPIGTSTDPLYLAYSSFTGALDDVRIYARALSPAEINDLYQNP
jgi:hypothetical protein